ncbi:hypothetical protein ACFSCX_21280 [Bacillus salitolerans]|uniref:Uncharacterized protein n=1 Tax=Bacillus salitolerans TaxID=1437434 RepID=A0ABW4LY50_9BACI
MMFYYEAEMIAKAKRDEVDQLAMDAWKFTGTTANNQLRNYVSKWIVKMTARTKQTEQLCCTA